VAEEIIDLDELLRTRKAIKKEVSSISPKEGDIYSLVEKIVRKVLDERLISIEEKLDKILKLLEEVKDEHI